MNELMIFLYNVTMRDRVMQLLNVYEAAEMLSVCRRTIELWKAERRIPYVRLGRRTLYDYDDLKGFIELHKVPILDPDKD